MRFLRLLRVQHRNASQRCLSSNPSTALVHWELDVATKIGTITLNSPETFNALTVEMGRDFSSLCRDLEHDLTTGGKECHAIVLTGAGNKAVPVPVIAALQGPAIGAGAGLALACDMRTSADKPKILGFNFSSLGIHSGMGGSYLLEKALGGPAAIMNEILFTGRVLSGKESFDLKLVNRLSDAAKNDAYELAEKISKQHPLAIRTMVKTIRSHQDVGLEAALHREAFSQAVCYNRHDWGEGVDAVAEKREPNFHEYHAH